MRAYLFTSFCIAAGILNTSHAQIVAAVSAPPPAWSSSIPTPLSQAPQVPPGGTAAQTGDATGQSANGQNQPGQDAVAQQKKIQVTDTVTVTAPGEDRDVQSINDQLLQESTPGTSPIEALSHLPSVEVTKSDPYGAYEWALRINVRGFNQNQLGFTLDDVPLGDMSYGNLNGLHISRALIDEDMGHTVVSQGTGSLAVASNSNLGATVQFYSSDPLDKRRFDVRQSNGSYNGNRTFGRYDSGTLGNAGTKFYIAGVYQRADKWKSLGQINQHYYQINGKLIQQIGSKGLFTYYIDYSNRAEVDYQDLNKIWVNTLGYGWDNFGDWGTSVQAANAYNAQAKTPYALYPGVSTNFPSPVSNLQSGYGDLSNDPEDAGYYGASGLRKDLLTYASYRQAITDHVTFAITGYGHRNDGRGLWFQPYLPSFTPNYTQVSPISLRTSEYGISRGGVVASVSHETPKNLLETGIWFEKETFDLARRFYGTTVASPVYSLYTFPTNPFFTQWAYTFPEYVIQGHIQDTFHFSDKLSASAGFKGISTNLTGTLAGFDQGLSLLRPADTSATYAQGQLISGKPFLPQFGADYKINTTSEVFADVARNVRAFQAGGNGFGTSPWGTTQAGFNALTANLQPESSWSEEGGYRFNGKKVQAQGSYFHVNFSNRLLAIAQGPAVAGDASILSNVGGVTTNGADGALNIRVANGWTLYNALTFSRSAYNSNYTAGGVVIPTGGKITIDSPEVLYKNELAYRHSGWDAHIATDFLGKRYFTYTDDGSVGSRAVVDFGTSYHKDEVGPFEQLKLQFNVFNLADNKYWDTIGTNGFVASDPQSLANNTLQEGFPRAFTGTFSARF